MTTLLFVYNADDGVFAAIGDAVHKVISPDTYPCSLCAITYGALRMRPGWKAYLRSLPYEIGFFHRPDFKRAYPNFADLSLPAILVDKGAGPYPLIDSETLDNIGNLEELITALDAALKRQCP
ncbi:hypothetical protein [uncultured Sphingomonas sp.]|uniref:hypothetical protein n=1 Tax=uncultured Sphingomonas sp. TaxID=158754 RepID=UPI0035CBDA78